MSESRREGARTIWSVSGVSAFTGQPFVQLGWNQESAQMTPDEARAFGLHVIEAADAAVMDAHLRTVLTGMGLATDEVDFVFVMFRQARGHYEEDE